MLNASIAARNLARNRRRTLTALFIVGVGVIAMVLADGFIQWIFWAMREGVIESQLGHIQIERPGFHTSGAANPYSYLLPEKSPVLEAVESTSGVKQVAPRLSITGLISHGETTIPFLADGVDPAKDKTAELSQALRIAEGRNLSRVGAPEVILGRGLARSLGVGPGAKVSLLATTAGGSLNGVEATVVGLFVTPNQAYDDSALRVPIALAQSLVRVEGAQSWIVLLRDTGETDAVLQQFRSRFGGPAYRLDFIPWYTRADFYNKTVALFSKQINVLRAIIAFIIILTIFNILVMNVLERTGEIGTLLAIGFKRSAILHMFATEGFLLGVAGGLLGVLAGYGLAELISAIGIPMPPPPGMDQGVTGRIRVSGMVVASAFLVAFVPALLAGLYPAWKASRLQIVDALRQNI